MSAVLKSIEKARFPWGRRRLHGLSILFLLLLTFAAFSQVPGNDFITLDDPHYVTGNDRVQQGLSFRNIVWAFTTMEAANWHPLTWLSHMLDVECFGMDPQGHHVTSLLLHMVNATLLFAVLKAMTGERWPSFFVAALFAVHPLRVESVAWVAERKDVLSTFFWFSAMGAYCRYARRPGIKRYLLVALLLGLGLMAKPMLVTLPFLFLLLDYWPLDRLGLSTGGAGNVTGAGPGALRLLLLEKIPLLALTAVSGALTYLAQAGGRAVHLSGSEHVADRLANVLTSYVKYIGKVLYPFNLSVFYPWPLESWPLWQTAGSFLLLAAVTLLVLRAGRRAPWLILGWLWYLGTLVPVIGFIRVGMQAMADRYTYVPAVGLFIMAAWAASKVTDGRPSLRLPVALTGGTVVLALAVLTWVQTGQWKDSVRLYEHDIESSPTNWVAHSNLGKVYFERGEIDKAMFHFRESMRINPTYIEPVKDMASALIHAGETEEAKKLYFRSLEIDPEDPSVYYRLGNLMMSSGDLRQAESYYRKVLRLDPENMVTLVRMGNILAGQGMLEESMEYRARVLEMNPEDAEVHNHYGVSLAEVERLKEAVWHFEEAVRIDPGYSDAFNNLGIASIMLGNKEEGITYFKEALRVDPGNKKAQLNLLKALGP